MNALVFTRAVWGPDAFSSLAEDLGPLQGALSASFALRAEVLAALFGTRRFHVVFSPYVRPAVCPLATLYLPRYGHLIRNMTLELDCTRLGYGMHPAAAGLQPGLLSMGALVAAFVESVVSAASPQGETDAAPPLDSLNVLCRRYYGNRPASCAKVDEGATPAAAAATATAITTTPADMPYVGPEVERVAGQLRQLAGLASSVRFVGFSEAFTLEMLATVGGRNKGSEGSESSERSVHIWRRSPSDFYPLLPGHSAYVDCGPELGICLLSHTALSLLLCPSTKGSTKRSEHGDADDDDNDDDDDVKTIFISDTSTSTPVSTPVSINSPALTKRTTALSLAHLAHLHDARPRLAVLPSKPAKACRQGRRRGPTFLALFGFCQQQQQGQLRQQQRPSSLVGVQLAAVGLAVGAVGSPLRLSKNGFKGGRGRVAGNGMTMDEESRIVDEVASVCLDDLKEQCVGQDPSQPQDKQEEEQQQQQHRPRRRLQKRRYDQQPSLVWSW
ncbi:hypothetical protein SCUCBS95973_001396 [Sporothrix curviconia]|uniref:Uncharacterized protein n=1 Tax=Sporothrix curviconia TaxID=1260050 RepID=A0ABP0AY94_9PEZI